MNFNGRVLVIGRSSRPLVDIVPEEQLQESQWAIRSHKSKVSVVGNDMGNITLRGTLKRVVI